MVSISKPAIFLDRDGTINVEKQYLYKVEDWEWIPGAIEAIKLINKMGYLAIVVTNQAGIARGYYSESDVITLHQHVNKTLAKSEAKIDAYYYCPHHPEYGVARNCICRKPNSGMLISASNDFNIDLSKSYLIGDKITDMMAAKNVGVSAVLVMTGYGEIEKRLASNSTVSKPNILAAVEYIVEETIKNKNKDKV